MRTIKTAILCFIFFAATTRLVEPANAQFTGVFNAAAHDGAALAREAHLASEARAASGASAAGHSGHISSDTRAANDYVHSNGTRSVEGYGTVGSHPPDIVKSNAGMELENTGLHSSTRKTLAPQSNANGHHTVFKRDSSGSVSRYETYTKNENPRDPKPWVRQKSVDVVGESHYNKVTKKYVPTPHAHDPKVPGGVRVARQSELPRK